MKRIDAITTGWNEYELLDSGENRKLERFGAIVLDRPDPQALWEKTNPLVWQKAHAHFMWSTKGERWAITKGTDEQWDISCGTISMKLSFAQFKHIGIFPEHEVQWSELKTLLQKKTNTHVRMLNLFGYTGAASLVAAQAGAQVTHVDASKQTIATVKENIILSGLPSTSIRIVTEDALKYAKRLIQRGEQFEVIVMDPPAFGRGPKGEVWKIEEKLLELMALISQLLSPDAQLVILNGYAAGYSARTFGELLADTMKNKGGTVSYGDVGIQQTGSERVLSTGIYGKWQK